MAISSDGTQNRLLTALSKETFSRLEPRVETLPLSHVVFQTGEEVRDVIFPHEGTVVSLIRGSLDGGEVEVGLVGCHGYTEVHSVLGATAHRTEGVIQAKGKVSRVSVDRVREVIGSDARCRALLLSYVSVHLDQVTQNAVCNGLHNIEQRLSKWLLLMRDRVGSDTLNLTHEFLAQMLGIRRSGVTTAVGMLSEYGLIEHARNRIVLLKRPAIEERACGCYREIRAAVEAFDGQLRGDPEV
jgi:CRP-like cAMP-binding protein